MHASITLDDIGVPVAYALVYLIVVSAIAWLIAARRLRTISVRQ